MYRIKTKYVNKKKSKKTITAYAETKKEIENIQENIYDFIEYTEAILIEQKIEKGYFIKAKKIYNYKLKN